MFKALTCIAALVGQSGSNVLKKSLVRFSSSAVVPYEEKSVSLPDVPYYSTVVVEAEEEKSSTLELRLKQLQMIMQKDPTCLFAQVYKDVAHPSAYILSVKWQSVAAYVAYMRNPLFIHSLPMFTGLRLNSSQVFSGPAI